MSLLQTPLTKILGTEYPIIGGAMYPCSNPELVAAVSAAGGIGVLQPLSLVYVNQLDFREGLKHIRSFTDKPIGMNVLTEKSSKKYLERMSGWLDIALEEGVRFFVSSLGNPSWIVDRVSPVGGIVFHDVTARKWALKATDAGVHGLVAVNNRAGGHAGELSAEQLLEELSDLGLPVVCAGGIGDPTRFRHALDLGYAGVQIGTRLIATTECTAPAEYKEAIIRVGEEDIVLTNKLTGVPVSVIRTPFVEKTGTEAGPIIRWLLGNSRTKHWMRALLSLRSFVGFKRAAQRGMGRKDYFQAGKSVDGIASVKPVKEIIDAYVAAISDS